MYHKPSISLGQILAEMFVKANSIPGYPVRKALGSGLQVDVLITPNGKTKLQISRNGNGPSQTEWRTVLNCLPYKIKADYKSKRIKGRIYFMASWDTPIQSSAVGELVPVASSPAAIAGTNGKGKE